MPDHKLLATVSLALSLACSNTASTQRDAGTTATAPQAQPASAVQANAKALPSPNELSRAFVEVARTVRPSVVAVTSVSTVQAPSFGSPFDFFFRGVPRPEGGRQQRRQGIGSGVIIDTRGFVLTNNHVVQDADELKVVLGDDRELEAEVVGTDPNTDLAVIKIKDAKVAQTLQPATLGDSDALEVGEWVMAVGSPFGLRQTVSAGIISAVSRGRVGIADYEDFIQTDAAINPGNSGGPLVSLNGRVIGINTAIASQTGGYQGVGFAIPISMARTVMKQLIEHGEVVRGYLGVYITDVSEELAKSFNYPAKGGALVQDVSPDGPAAKAGLKPGDIVTKRDGKQVTDTVVFRNAIAATKPGTTVSLHVWREGKEQELKVKLEELPNDQGRSARRAPSGPGRSGTSGRGLQLSDLTPELKRRLGAQVESGAVVVGVAPGSAAEGAGLAPGDVIVQIGDQVVKNASDTARLLNRANPAAPLRLRVVREGRGLFVILPPSERQNR
jgi:serine protease Do